MKMPRNHYDNLKISRNASEAEIRKAYRGLASIHHPDRNGNSPKSIRAMQCINSAYETLKSPAMRATHDAWIGRMESAHRQKQEQPKPQPQWSEQHRPQSQSQWSDHKKYQHSDFGGRQKDHSYYKTHSSERKSENKFDDFMRGYRDDFDFSQVNWRSAEKYLRPEHRPKKFDEKHRGDFTKYNAAMRRNLEGVHLEYVTPELIYRAFIIDKRRGKGAPKNLEKAYKAINRALKNKPAGILGKLIGLYLGCSQVVQGATFGTFLCTLVFLFTWLVVDWLSL